MAIGIRVRLIGDEAYLSALSKLTPAQNRRIFSESLEKSVNAVWKDATENQIRRGRRSQPPADGFLTERSGAEGIIGSIGVDLSELPRAASVGSWKIYPRLHEVGEGRFPARPWLQPAVDVVVPEKSERWAVQAWERQVRSSP